MFSLNPVKEQIDDQSDDYYNPKYLINIYNNNINKFIIINNKIY